MNGRKLLAELPSAADLQQIGGKNTPNQKALQNQRTTLLGRGGGGTNPAHERQLSNDINAMMHSSRPPHASAR
jgi:hypothetical protein